MKNSQRGFIVPLITIIALLLIGGGAYVYMNKYQQKQNVSTTEANSVSTTTTQNSSITNATVNWKTYTNNKYGYQIQYPENSVISALDSNGHTVDVSNNSYTINIKSEAIFLSILGGTYDGPGNGPGAVDTPVKENIVLNGQTYSAGGFLSDGNVYLQRFGGSNGGTSKNMTVSSIKGFHITYGFNAVDKGQQTVNQNDVDAAGKLVKEILSTFKIIDVVSTNSEITIVIPGLNGNFVSTDTLVITDANNKKWTVNYKDVKFYEENAAVNPSIWPADFNTWLKMSKETLAPGYSGSGSEGSIKITGVVRSDILYASQIVHHAQ